MQGVTKFIGTGLNKKIEYCNPVPEIICKKSG
jgi:hypothetical protein